MKLLFSGAQNLNVEQNEINKSLGGFMSSTKIPNNKLNAIFSDLSQYDLKTKNKNVIGIFINNDTANDINNLTIQNIYQNKLGKKVNLCDFDFGVSEVTASGSIEIIGSIFEEPFYVDWFNAESKYEDCTIKLIQAGSIGDDFSIFDTLGILSGDDIKSFQSDIVNLLNSLDDFYAEAVGDNSVYVRKTKFEITNIGTDFVSSGSALIVDTNLAGGLIGETIIADRLEPSKSLGLWIRRKINDNYKLLNSSCEDISKRTEFDKKEVVEIIFSYD
jgi:hypothetical protein